MSWCISYLLQYVIGYRRKVVQANLANSFPEKSKAELRKLERAFYHHLCNVGVETVMLAAFGERRFRRHVCIENPELIEELHKENKRIFFLLGHYGNWEWYTGCQLLLPVTEFNVAFVRQKGAWHYVLSKPVSYTHLYELKITRTSSRQKGLQSILWRRETTLRCSIMPRAI